MGRKKRPAEHRAPTLAACRGGRTRLPMDDVPRGPGVYLLQDADRNVVYVGKAVDLRRRVGDHARRRRKSQPWLRRKLRSVAEVQTVPTETELDALLLEAKLIHRHLPVANLQLRQRYQYPYIRVDIASRFPRLDHTRTPGPDGALYFGPFGTARLAGAVADYLKRRFGIRECARSNLPDGRPCALLDLGACLGPCVGAVSPAEYRAALDRAVEMLERDWPGIADGLEARMRELADAERFEEAADLRNVVRRARAIADRRYPLIQASQLRAVVLEPVDEGPVRLTIVSDGRLVRSWLADSPIDPQQIADLCTHVFGEPGPPPLTPQLVEEAKIVASWVRRQQKKESVGVVLVDHESSSATAERVCGELDRLAGLRSRPS